VLAKIDPRSSKRSSMQANEKALAGRARALGQAQEKDAQRKYERTKQLLIRSSCRSRTSTPRRRGRGRAGEHSGVGGPRSRRPSAARQQAQVNLAYTTITSPIDGTVISRASTSARRSRPRSRRRRCSPSPRTSRKMQVDTNVSEADVGKLDGMEPRASRSTRSRATALQAGRIRQIRYAPQVVQNVVTYDAVIDVENDELLLRPGMTANVTFVYARSKTCCGCRTPRCASSLRPPRRSLMRASTSTSARDAPTRRTAARSGCSRRRDADAVPVKTGVSDGTFTVVEGDVGSPRATRSSPTRAEGADAPSRPAAGRLGPMRRHEACSERAATDEGGVRGPLIRLEDVEDLPHGRRRRARAAPACPSTSSEASSSRHGRLGLGQVDADEHRRVPRSPDAGRYLLEWKDVSGLDRNELAEVATRPARLRLPVVQPARAHVGRRERRAAARLRRRRHARAPAARARR
jgi:hypothetical protein